MFEWDAPKWALAVGLKVQPRMLHLEVALADVAKITHPILLRALRPLGPANLTANRDGVAPPPHCRRAHLAVRSAPARMTSLLDWICAYQQSPRLPERMRLAEELIHTVGPALRAYVERRVPPGWVADAFQEILIAIVQNLHQFQGGTGRKFWAWCYRIARNKCAGAQRQRPEEELWDTHALQPMPAVSGEAVREGTRPARAAEGVRFVGMEGRNAVFEVVAGDDEFASEFPARRAAATS